MKIIGNTQYGVIVEASQEEILQIAGRDTSWGATRESLKIGAVINVGSGWTAMRDLRVGLANDREALVNGLRRMADNLELHDIVDSPAAEAPPATEAV